MRYASNAAPRPEFGGALHPAGPGGQRAAAPHVIDPAILLQVFLKPQDEVGLVMKVEPNADQFGAATVTISLSNGETLGPLAFVSRDEALTFCRQTVDAAKTHDAGAVVVLELATDV